MALSDEQKDQVEATFKAKGLDVACKECGKGGPSNLKGLYTLAGDDELIPLVASICTGCGHINLFTLRGLGVSK